MADLPQIPRLRLQAMNQAPLRPERDVVLYWLIGQRRVRHHFGLDHAVSLAVELGKPLLIFEPLRCGYRWASDRMHRFVIDGMADNAERLAVAPVTYYAYWEEHEGDGSGLLEALAARAAIVLTDEVPGFFLPRMVRAAAARLDVRLETIDSNGLLPLRAPDKLHKRAVDFRRFLQKSLAPHLLDRPHADPFADIELPTADVPTTITDRWPNRAASLAAGQLPDLDALSIDHAVAPVSNLPGGATAAEARLDQFIQQRLGRYSDGRLDLCHRSTSGLSPYLHVGHISAHQVFEAVAARESWSPGDLGVETARGQREGYWGMGSEAEGFLDELVTWRELCFSTAFRDPHFDRYESLPEWARRTLDEHAADPRDTVYDLATFESAATHDPIWNAAQRELVDTGRIHNYLRMLWGKKILEWSPTPQDALATMIELNNKYALDGRDPNSYGGIFWCLGRYDRAWQERPIFGKIRYMSSESTRRKCTWGDYLDRFEAWSEETRRDFDCALDVFYGDDPRERLDIFRAQGSSGPVPVQLFFHGGYWRSSSKERYSFLARNLCPFGAVAVVVALRLLLGVVTATGCSEQEQRAGEQSQDFHG